MNPFNKGDRVAVIPQGLYYEEQRGSIIGITYGYGDEWISIEFDRKFSGYGRAVHIHRIRHITIYDLMKDNVLNNQELTKIKKISKTH